MNIKLIFIISTFFPCFLFGQSFNKKYFEKTKWFSNNQDSMFYKQDTIHLIKYCNINFDDKTYRENPSAHFKYIYYVDIAFRNKKVVGIWEIKKQDLNQEVKFTKDGSWKWNKEQQLLELFIKGVLVSTLKPFAEREIKIKTSDPDFEVLKTTELILVKNK